MRFLGLEIKRTSGKTPGVAHPVGNVLNFLMPRTNVDYENEIEALDNSAIMAITNYLGRTLPEAPLMLREVESKEDIHTHPMLSLWRRPNEYFSGKQHTAAIGLSLWLDGNAYLYKVRDKRTRQVMQLWYMPHWLVEPLWPRDKREIFISGYKYAPGGLEGPLYLDVNDVVHIRWNIDPRNTRKGLSPIKPLLREIFTDEESSAFVATLLRNFGIPGIIVSPEKDVTAKPQDVEAVQAYIDEMYSKDNRGRALALRGATRVEQFGFSPKDLDLGQLRKIPESRIAAMSGIPAAVVGFLTGMEQTAVGATLSELREQAYESAIMPLHGLVNSQLEIQLLDEFEPDPTLYDVVNDISNVRVLQEDVNKKSERIRQEWNDGLITREVGKVALGYEPNPGDAVYKKKIIDEYVDANATVDELTQTVEDVPEDETETGAEEKLFTLKVLTPQHKDLTEEQRQKLINTLLKQAIELYQIWALELEESFKSLGKQIADASVEVLERDAAFSLSEKQRKQEDDSYVEERALAEQIMLDVGFLNLRKEYGAQYIRVFLATVDTIKTITGLGVDMPDEAGRAVIAAGGKRQGLIDLTRQTKDSLFRAILEGRSLGEGPKQLIPRIEARVAAGPWSTAKIRARVIARTETKYAQNISSLMTYKYADNVSQIQVFDAQGDFQHAECIAQNGRVVSLEEADALAESEHPNGTRSFAPIVS